MRAEYHLISNICAFQEMVVGTVCMDSGYDAAKLQATVQVPVRYYLRCLQVIICLPFVFNDTNVMVFTHLS